MYIDGNLIWSNVTGIYLTGIYFETRYEVRPINPCYLRKDYGYDEK